MDKRQWSTELGGLIVDENLTIVARVSFYEKGEISDDQELIAAAPDLLRASKNILRALNSGSAFGQAVAMSDLEKVIKKAEGL